MNGIDIPLAYDVTDSLNLVYGIYEHIKLAIKSMLIKCLLCF